ncbi:putative malate protein [Neofusicoccum parvum UCRNP2]|uniref:Malic enzyme n=1 Tax=Botryosphaeria parva (strain UCR-NP2) TaxID=1287680 RepID=R1GJV2_BOTPV|nr:putative malate protein [Neofusicoccum parvum UCRNP2]
MSSKQDQKHPKFGSLPLSTSGPQDCALTGSALLNTPYLNKGTAFTKEERDEFKLHGLLPQNVQKLEEQVKRAYDQFCSRPNDLAKNTFMTSMKEQNEVLYYRQLIQDHLKEMFSIIYTPTEGDAIANYSRLFRRPEGCFLNIDDVDRIPDDLDQFGPSDEVDLIVVSDGEQNEELLNDDLYLGLRKPRVRGEKYDAFVDKFITAARKRYPRAYIHFEDFGLPNARRILDSYTPKIACFNDDVQGTGCVTLAAIMSAMKIADIKYQDLRVVMFGAGTAGTGIADQIKDAIAVSTEKSKEEAGAQIWCVDKPGLLLKSKKNDLTPAQVTYAKEDSEWEGKGHNDLLSVVKEVKPHVLIGTSTKPGSFTKEVVEEMAKHVERPIIFPLSNPTRLHEAKPKDLFEWTKGKCLVATGSPFEPVEYEGKKYEIAECNNSTTFPGIGLGAVLSRTRLMTPSLLVAATESLASQAPALKDENKGTPREVALLPDVTDVREISVHIAKAVIQKAVEEGLNQEKGIPSDEANLEEWIREQMWDPVYRPLRRVKPEKASRHARGESGSASVRRQGSFSYHA